jgi:hypothetical protein
VTALVDGLYEKPESMFNACVLVADELTNGIKKLEFVVVAVVATFVALVALVADPTESVLCATYCGAAAPAINT